jgi:hypothetical protein
VDRRFVGARGEEGPVLGLNDADGIDPLGVAIQPFALRPASDRIPQTDHVVVAG